MFDESYQNGYEDVDLCFKVREKHEKVVLCPEVEIIHHESKTPGRFDYVSKNSKLLNEKWHAKIIPDDLNKLFKPLVSIVIPVYNQLDYTRKCLDSIRQFTFVPYEIIIVNDASTDGTEEYLRSQKDLIVKANTENLGYPNSCNIGIQSSSGKYVVLLNNDTIVTRNWLENLLEVFKLHPKVGLVGPVSNNISGFQIEKEAKYSTINSMHQFAEQINIKRKYAWMLAPRIAFVCAVISREVINTIGGLDERFAPGNFEDDDYCLRVQLAGFKTVIATDVLIHHYGSKSFKSNSVIKYEERLKKNLNIFKEKWGADPEEIWLQQKTFNRHLNLFISIDKNLFLRNYNDAQILIGNKEYNRALEKLVIAISNYDGSADSDKVISKEDLLLLTANTSMLSEEFEKAREYFEQVLSMNPISSQACYGLGEIFYAAGMFQESKTMFEWALKNNPINLKNFNALKIVNEKLELPLNDYSLKEKIDSSELEKAERLIEQKESPKAEKILLELLKNNPLDIDLLNDYSVLMILNNQTNTALDIFERILILDPENETAKSNLAYMKNFYEV